MDALVVALIVAGSVCVVVWVLSVITHEHSWVDRIWSIVPAVYVWIFAGFAGFSDARLDLMAAVATIWGARLTFNFARKGGYSGEEDYRWAILRGRMKRWQFEIFNVFFIVIYQNAVLLLIALPAFTAYVNPAPFSGWDVAVAALFLACTIGETVADQQQWDFQTAKYALIARGGTPSANFRTTGLFAISRHPNFFFELAQWWVFFLFGVVAGGSFLQWTVLGAVLLTTVFIGSTRFTEAISLGKYPEYADYQRRVSAVVPWFPRRRADGPATTAA